MSDGGPGRAERARIPIPPGGFKTNEDEARWLEKTIILRTQEMMFAAGVVAQINPNGLYELLLMCLDGATKRGVVRG